MGKDLGFEVIKIVVFDGEKILNVIDSLVVSGVKGFVICIFDLKLGLVIEVKVCSYNLKVIVVDD